jgi:hypothetical protein
MDNLRAGYRWAADRHHIETATAIAAHATWISYSLAQWEAAGWVEELVPAAVEADVRQLPRLLSAAVQSIHVRGHADSALGYARLASQLESTGRYESLPPGWCRMVEAIGLFHAGDSEAALSIFRDLAAAKTAVSSRACGLAGLLLLLPTLGRADEAALIADDAAAAAKEWGSPIFVAFSAGYCYGRAFAAIDPPRALQALRWGLDYSRQHRFGYAELVTSHDLAVAETDYGDLHRGLDLFDFSLDNWQRAGDLLHLPLALASVAMCFARLGEPEIAATIYGGSASLVSSLPKRTRPTHHGASLLPTPETVAGLLQAVEDLRANLGATGFDQHVATGAAMETGDAVSYARQQIRLARGSTDTMAAPSWNNRPRKQ